MKEGRSVQNLAGELKRQLDSKKDYHVSTSLLSMTLSAESQMRLSGLNSEDVGITSHCHSQFAERLKIPKKYYDRMLVEAPELLTTNVNHWFQSQNEKRLVRLLDGNARAFLSNRYRPIDNWDIASIALPKIQALDCKLKSCELTESKMYLKAVTERITEEVKVGDAVQAGIMISNSEIGKGSVQVVPMVYRLKCLNGMIMPDFGTKKYHTGRWIQELEDAVSLFSQATLEEDNKAFFMKVQDIMNGALSKETFGEIVAKLKTTLDRRMEKSAEKVIEDISKRFQMTEDESGSVLNHLIEGGDLSQWGLANAVTRASQDLGDYDRATDFETIGGSIVEYSDADWKEIATKGC